MITFLIYFYKKQPFSEESLWFFNNFYSKDYTSNKSILSINNNQLNENLIFTPSRYISNLFKYIFKPLERVKRKVANKNILDFSGNKTERKYYNDYELDYQSTQLSQVFPQDLNKLTDFFSDESKSTSNSYQDHIYKLGTLKPIFRSHLKDKDKLQKKKSNQLTNRKLDDESTIKIIRKSISINMKDELIKTSKLVYNEKCKYHNKCNSIKDQENSCKLPIFRYKTLADESSESVKIYFSSEISKQTQDKNIFPGENEENENYQQDKNSIVTQTESNEIFKNSKILNSSSKNKLLHVDSIFSPLISNESLQSRNLLTQEQNINFESIIYKLMPDNTLSKQKMVVVEKDIYLFKYSCNKNNFILDSIQSLSGLYITSYEEIIILEKTFYPFALVGKYGNTLSNVNNLFFFRMKKEMQMIFQYIKKLMGYKEIKHDYEIINSVSPLGRGQFGKVKLAKNKKTQEKVAVKLLDKTNLKYSDFYFIRNEVDILRILKAVPHENIVIPFDFYEDKNYIYIVTEYLEAGNLSDYLINLHNVIPEKKSKIICKQLAKGINHLHKLGIVHRDIKTENILVCEDNRLKIKIIDFGLSKFLFRTEKRTECLGTLIFTAPEVINRISYDIKIDIWSYGILTYYINCGRFPYDTFDDNIDVIKGKICSETLSFDKCKFSNELKTLIEDCVEKNVSQRIKINQVLESKWFSK